MRRLVLVVLVLVLSAGGLPGRAQDSPAQPLVVFVLDQKLEIASVVDPRPEGISRLGQIFEALGARTATISLDQPVPKDAQIVVLVRPQSQLTPSAVARLWTYLAQGGSLLIALDPVGHERANPEKANSGLLRLLGSDFGITLADTFVVEPWFTVASISAGSTSYSHVYADLVPNPITAPLSAYELPVQVWGARSMQVESLGLYGQATPLLRAISGYGEAGKIFDQKSTPAPLEFTPNEDVLGPLDVAALGQNPATGSRIVVLGDSEMLLNQYGLALVPNSLDPVYLGDYLLAERIAAWLLNVPVEQWPALPTGYTWLALDGDGSDWPTLSTVEEDSLGDAPNANADIQMVRAFRNQDFLYLLVELDAAPDLSTNLRLTVSGGGTGESVFMLYGDGHVEQTGSDTPTPIPDGRLAAGTALEARLPVRAVGVRSGITQVCLVTADNTVLDCMDNVLTPADVAERAPSDLLFTDGPVATVTSNTPVNLRNRPGLDGGVVAMVEYGRTLAVTGRSAAGDWLKVQNARYSGWISTLLVIVNTSLDTLPVIPSS